MAVTTTNLALTNIAYVNSQYPSTHYQIDSTQWYSLYRSTTAVIPQPYMFAKLSAFPSALKHNQLRGIQFNFQIDVSRRGEVIIYRSNDFDDVTITWYTKPTFDKGTFLENFTYTFSQTHTGNALIPETLYGTTNEVLAAAYILQSSALCLAGGSTGFKLKTVLENGDPITAIVSYDDAVIVTSRITYKSGPKSGYANPRNDITFSWDYSPFGYCADPTWGQTSATFYWKKSTDANYTAVPAGISKSVTIPANTFRADDTISWYVEGTDDEGTTTQTEVFSFSTSASSAVATVVSPLNTVEDGSAPITFRWQITSEDGQPASRVRAMWKLPAEDESSWRILVDANEAITSYDAPGGTIQAGEIQWKVQAFNVDDVEGAWSEGTFICVAAPNPVGGLNATNVPYSTVTWQSGEQQAYQISVDGTVVKKAFGADVYSYILTEPLDDGTHEISVIVQGIYGYWSQSATVTVNIQNVPGDAVVLQGETGIDAALSWDTSSTVSDFYVYRDGVNIGHTNSTAFYDKMSLGSHSYFVRNKLTDGNYTQSNTVVVTSEARGTFISLLNDNNWLEITRSENSASEQSYNYNRQYSLNHYSGAVYPVLELSPFENVYGSYNFACKDYATAKAFETFRGKEVIIKSRGDVVMVGAMVSLSSHYGDFINGYTFSIQRIHVEDYIDDTNA